MRDNKELIFLIILIGWVDLTMADGLFADQYDAAADSFRQGIKEKTAQGELLDQLPEEQKGFVKKYIDAINSKNDTALKQLIHPSVMQCVTAGNSDYFENDFSSNWGDSISPNACILIQR